MSTSAIPAVAPEQERYARVLGWGTQLGFAFLVVGFLAYVLGLMPPHVPLERLPELWNRPAAEFLRETGMRAGWGWLEFAHRGDVLNTAGLAVLASCSVPSLLAVAPIFHARRDRVYVAICILEVAVIALAASGILVVKH
jgi:hypothetical protein